MASAINTTGRFLNCPLSPKNPRRTRLDEWMIVGFILFWSKSWPLLHNPRPSFRSSELDDLCCQFGPSFAGPFVRSFIFNESHSSSPSFLLTSTRKWHMAGRKKARRGSSTGRTPPTMWQFQRFFLAGLSTRCQGGLFYLQFSDNWSGAGTWERGVRNGGRGWGVYNTLSTCLIRNPWTTKSDCVRLDGGLSCLCCNADGLRSGVKLIAAIA